MNLPNLFKRRSRLPNIAVYGLEAIVDGTAKASPLGFIPRFPANFEGGVRETHHPSGNAFLNEDIQGTSVILCWQEDTIEAVCFLSCDEAPAYPGFTPLSDNRPDSVLTYFPR